MIDLATIATFQKRALLFHLRIVPRKRLNPFGMTPTSLVLPALRWPHLSVTLCEWKNSLRNFSKLCLKRNRWP